MDLNSNEETIDNKVTSITETNKAECANVATEGKTDALIVETIPPDLNDNKSEENIKEISVETDPVTADDSRQNISDTILSTNEPTKIDLESTNEQQISKSVRFSEEINEIDVENQDKTTEESNFVLETTAKDTSKSVRFSTSVENTITNEEITDDTHKAVQSLEDSEYETPEPEDDEVDIEDEEDEVSNASASGESTSDSQVLTEREEGDGEEESDKKDGKKKDHDEDKRDPQYIPKKGNFYEHDDRTVEDGEEPIPKKVLPLKTAEPKESSWKHDLYCEDLQSPKSKEELIDQYGYDIRVEEGPPKARRRRKYGRGPNKYTRHWEEVDAYIKSRPAWRGGPRGRGRGNNIAPRNTNEDFPPLQHHTEQNANESSVIEQEKHSDEPTASEKKTEPSPERLPLQRKYERAQKDNRPDDKNKTTTDQEGAIPVSARGRKSFKQVYLEESQAQGSNHGSRVRGKGRGRIGCGLPFRNSMSHHQHGHASSNSGKKNSTAEEDIATLSQHFSQAVINVDNKIITINSQSNSKDNISPTRVETSNATMPTQSITITNTSKNVEQTTQIQQEQQPQKQHKHNKQNSSAADRNHNESNINERTEAKSKRYSTQRQRSLPQGSPQVPQQQGPNSGPPQQRFMQDQFYHQGIEASGPPPSAHGQYTNQSAPPATFPAEVPLMAFIPPGGQFQPMYVPPPPYIPQPPIPVQVSACPQAPPPRAELYQGAGGITYYNTQSQVNRPVHTSRRVKLAIPIVPPPESS